MYKFKIDNREPIKEIQRYIGDCIEAHKKYSGAIELSVEKLSVGDYQLLLGEKPIAIFERKTLADLAASIKDSRLDNIDGMLLARKNYDSQLYFIIEGRAFPKDSDTFGRMPYKTLRSAIHTLMVSHSMMVVQTRDLEHTCKELAAIAVKYVKKYCDEPAAATTLRCLPDAAAIPCKMWLSTGIPFTTATNLIETLTIAEFIGGAECPVEIPRPLSKSLQVRMLARIDRISIDKAKAMIDCGLTLDVLSTCDSAAIYNTAKAAKLGISMKKINEIKSILSYKWLVEPEPMQS